MMQRTAVLLLLLILPLVAAGEDTRVVIDTDRQQMRVYSDGEEIMHVPRVALGRGGASHTRVRGDQTTPMGDFRVAWVNESSRFHVFLGLNYPRFDHVSAAYKEGTLAIDEFLAVTDALKARRLPPQDTAVGGHIGIHGLGEGDAELHRRANWTEGCVAITNEQMDALTEHVSVGTRVTITDGATDVAETDSP